MSLTNPIIDHAHVFLRRCKNWLIAEPAEALAAAIILLSTIPLALLQHDQWDGAIIADFLETRRFDGIRIWFVEGQGPLLMSVLWLVHQLDKIVGFIDWKLLSITSVVIGLIGLWSSAVALWNSKFAGVATLLVFVASPLFTLFASSMMAVILLLIGLGLLGFSMLAKGGRWRWPGAVLMIASVEIHPMIVLLAGLIGLLEMRRFISSREIDWMNVAVALSLPVAFYALYIQMFVAVGVYDSYNQFAAADFAQLIDRLWNSTFLSDFILPWAAILTPVMLAIILLHRSSRSTWLGSSEALLIILLGIAVAAPYALVNKFPPAYNFLDVFGWFGDGFQTLDNSNYRHAVLPHVCMALATGGIIALTRDYGRLRTLSWCAVAFAVLAQGVGLTSGWVENFDRDRDVAQLVSDLSEAEFDQHDMCQIDLSSYPAYQADRSRFYELSYFAGLAGSDRSTFLFSSRTDDRLLNFAIDISCRSPAHQAKYGVHSARCEQVASEQWQMTDLPHCLQ